MVAVPDLCLPSFVAVERQLGFVVWGLKLVVIVLFEKT